MKRLDQFDPKNTEVELFHKLIVNLDPLDNQPWRDLKIKDIRLVLFDEIRNALLHLAWEKHAKTWKSPNLIPESKGGSSHLYKVKIVTYHLLGEKINETS